MERLESPVEIEFAGLKVSRIVNGYGPATVLGGSVLDPRVTEAMEKISRTFVDMDELLDKAGLRIAEILDVEAAHVTSGAGSGLALCAAACMTGSDPSKIEKLPDTTDFEKNEIIIQTGHRNTYERCLRVSGAKLVSVGIPYLTYPWQLREAITERSAAISYFTLGTARPGVLGLEVVRSIAEESGVPVIVDGCNEVLPDLGSIKKLFSRGADLVVLSGGKGIQGPNDTGVICGRKDLVEACRNNSYPHMNGIGRTMKVSKEQIVGIVAALEVYSKINPIERLAAWTKKVDTVAESLEGVANVKVKRVPESPALDSIPILEIQLDEKAIGASATQIVLALKAYDPPIVLDIDYWKNFRTGTIFVNPCCLLDSEEKIVASALKRVLSDGNLLDGLLAKKNKVRANAYP